MPRTPKTYVDTRHDRYKIVYAVLFTGSGNHPDEASNRLESLSDAVSELSMIRDEYGIAPERIGIYEINLDGNDRIAWSRLMHESEYTS